MTESKTFSGRFYWVDIENLKRELIASTDFKGSSNYAYGMMLALTAVLAQGSEVFPKEASEFNYIELLHWLVGIGIQIWGFNKVYEANGGNDGRHFFDRTIPLTWVVGIRFCLVWTLPGLAAVIVAGAVLGRGPIFELTISALLLALEVLYFNLLADHVKEIAAQAPKLE